MARVPHTFGTKCLDPGERRGAGTSEPGGARRGPPTTLSDPSLLPHSSVREAVPLNCLSGPSSRGRVPPAVDPVSRNRSPTSCTTTPATATGTTSTTCNVTSPVTGPQEPDSQDTHLSSVLTGSRVLGTTRREVLRPGTFVTGTGTLRKSLGTLDSTNESDSWFRRRDQNRRSGPDGCRDERRESDRRGLKRPQWTNKDPSNENEDDETVGLPSQTTPLLLSGHLFSPTFRRVKFKPVKVCFQSYAFSRDLRSKPR